MGALSLQRMLFTYCMMLPVHCTPIIGQAGDETAGEYIHPQPAGLGFAAACKHVSCTTCSSGQRPLRLAARCLCTADPLISLCTYVQFAA
jgi:hypothetical protein